MLKVKDTAAHQMLQNLDSFAVFSNSRLENPRVANYNLGSRGKSPAHLRFFGMLQRVPVRGHGVVTTTYTLRYMRMEDVPQVLEVDKLSFPLPWSARSYAFEINDNNSSHMITLEASQELAQNKGLIGAIQRLRRSHPARLIAGYAGFWLIDGEAHVSTIAVHPDFRGRGLGEVILAGALKRAIDLNAEYSVLEVRVSNNPALELYRKYEYQVVGQRKNYYRDNNEDAYLMHLAPLDAPYQERFNERLEKLHSRVDYTDLLVRGK